MNTSTHCYYLTNRYCLPVHAVVLRHLQRASNTGREFQPARLQKRSRERKQLLKPNTDCKSQMINRLKIDKRVRLASNIAVGMTSKNASPLLAALTAAIVSLCQRHSGRSDPSLWRRYCKLFDSLTPPSARHALVGHLDLFGFAASRAPKAVFSVLIAGAAIYLLIVAQYTVRFGDLMRDGYLHNVFGVTVPAMITTFHQNTSARLSGLRFSAQSVSPRNSGGSPCS